MFDFIEPNQNSKYITTLRGGKKKLKIPNEFQGIRWCIFFIEIGQVVYEIAVLKKNHMHIYL